ncbi:nicotinate-nucleotide adenylyltransferase [Pedomonas sp. V897]|uniref:nicotinate-nucleotide adenylyltransferase n=1 Tax=Pedomonas sp. V897 TaxID=3446482 RepID=UPI003EE1ABDF
MSADPVSGSVARRNAARWQGKRVGLLGGSFNPAHRGHLHISREALKRLRLDAVWWLVSPQNPLKSADGMAPLAVRLASARAMARDPRIVPTDVERKLGTRYTVDTLEALVALHPGTRFIWLMGGDNLQGFHRWRQWRRIVRVVPIAVLLRPSYSGARRSARVLGPLRKALRPDRAASRWTQWPLPAIICLEQPGVDESSTALRQRRPDWADAYGHTDK